MNINNKFTLGTVTIGAFAAAGTVAIGTAAATVDIASSFNVSATIAGVTITVPNPTISETGQIVTINNTGVQDITYSGVAFGQNETLQLEWNGTAWSVVSAGFPNVLALGAAVVATENINGALLSPAGTLTLELADGTHMGLLTAAAQTIGGVKTYLAEEILQGGLSIQTPTTVANVATGGAITTAGASVIDVTQAAAATSITLAAPTGAGANGRVLLVRNLTGSTGTITVGNVMIPPGYGAVYQYNGTAWYSLGSGYVGTVRKFYQNAAVTAGVNTITHNLALTTPKAATVDFFDVNGDRLDFKITSWTANTITFTSPLAVPTVDMTVLG